MSAAVRRRAAPNRVCRRRMLPCAGLRPRRGDGQQREQDEEHRLDLFGGVCAALDDQTSEHCTTSPKFGMIESPETSERGLHVPTGRWPMLSPKAVS
eukprot:953985-Prymnesium_polylepis.1